MTEFLAVKIPMNPWVILPVVVLVTVLLAYAVSRVVLRVLRRMVQRTSTEIDDRVYRLLERYLFPILIVGGLLLVVDTLPLPEKAYQAIQRLLALAGLLLALFLLTKGALLILRNRERIYGPAFGPT